MSWSILLLYVLTRVTFATVGCIQTVRIIDDLDLDLGCQSYQDVHPNSETVWDRVAAKQRWEH